MNFICVYQIWSKLIENLRKNLQITTSGLHYEKIVKYDNWCIDRSLSDKVLMSVTIYRAQDYKVPIVNPRWPPKIQDGRHEIQFGDLFLLN